MSKLRYCYDVECDGLLDRVTKIWCLVLVNPDTGEVKPYSDHDPKLPKVAEGLQELNKADIIFGHNCIGFDNVVLKKVLGWSPAPSVRVIDTWIMSMLLQYKRDHKHGLAGWGEKFKFPKLEFSDFTQYTQEMLTYCIRDVELNVLVYKELTQQAQKLMTKYPLFSKGLEVEMEFAKIEADIQYKGWKFDMDGAIKLLGEIDDKLEAIERVLEPRIGLQCVRTDGTVTKQPAWRKDGCYTLATVKHFGIEEERGRTDRPIEGEYSRVSFEQGKIGQIEIVKSYLYSIGWVPDEWNVEKVGNKWINKSPKITESSLEKLGPEAMMISEYYTIRSRKGILEGWIDAAKNSDGRLHGRMWTIGTPSFRCRHEIVCNIPREDSAYGAELRELLTCEPGTSIVGADSAGCQVRALCHYLGNDEFTKEVVHGDIHQRNADALGVSRKASKPFFFAYLFGAGAGKLGNILTGKTDAKLGAQMKEKFQNSVPGMKRLVTTLEDEYTRTGSAFGSDKAHIRGLDGRIIFVASPHQVLNYLLQTTEAITCKAAMVWASRKLAEERIMNYPIMHYHDEAEFVVKDEDVERTKEILAEAFTEGPKMFNVTCMAGESKSGKTYLAVH
jgi:DNA polymerase-1